MSTIRDLAREFNAQPHEVKAFAGLDTWVDGDELPADIEAVIREAWATAPEGPPDVATDNRNADAVLVELADVVDRAGYDEEL